MSQDTKDLTRGPASHTEARFTEEASARAYLESIRWPKGPVCPHCGGADRQYRIEANLKKNVRQGLLSCG
ncbi:MAG: transposase, partial [Burkholderiales bacterium]